MAAVSAPAGGSRLKGHQFVDRPIRYVAELVGTETDGERAIRWLIALMVLYLR
jgi:hypothetical protein